MGAYYSPLAHAQLQHWDGAVWNEVPAAAAGVNAMFEDVAAVAPDDVWAVGNYSETAGDLKALIQHWDGDSWTIVKTR